MPPIKKHDRQYDLVVFGATGYTGERTAEYVAEHVRTDLKWAIAGRSEAKLQKLAEDVKRLNPDRTAPGIEVVNLNDADIAALAKKTRVFLTTVGPYSLYGEHAFKACAETGTHYIDVTGEPPWLLKMIKKYEDTAKRTGAIMFPQSGIDSAPADLLTWALVQKVRTELDVPTKEVTTSIYFISANPSGGSLNTGMTLFDQFSLKEVLDASAPFAQSPIPHEEPKRPHSSVIQKILGVRNVPNLGLVTTSPNAPVDITVVERTWGLLSVIPTRKSQFYGPKFTWSQHYKARNWLSGVIIHWFLATMVLVLAFVPPCRNLVRKFIYQPGEGAEKEANNNDEVEYRGVAQPDSDKFGKKQAYGRAVHRGGMYYVTGVFMVEIALTILEDDIGLEGGVYTPACLGQALIDRMNKAPKGFTFEVQMLDS